MKNLLLLIGVVVLLASCTPDPYEIEKALVAKAINTTGNTELQRKIKFEKFELASALLVEDIKNALDTVVEARENFLLTEVFPFNLEREQEELYFLNELYEITQSSRDLFEANQYKPFVQEAQAKLDSAKKGIYDDAVINFINKYKYSLDTVYSKDSIAYLYDVVYLIGNAKTTETFSLYNDKVLTGKYTAADELVPFVDEVKVQYAIEADSAKAAYDRAKYAYIMLVTRH